MNGPPPDPRMTVLPTGFFEDPGGHAICLGIAGALIALGAWQRHRWICWAAWMGAIVVAFTSPWTARLNQAWFGAFPTIDKEGSLLFFLDGVHRRLYLHPLDARSDDAIRLIGVHAGHLWPTELLAQFASPMGAFNLQWLLQAGFAWAAAAWAARVVSSPTPSENTPPLPTWVAVVATFPFGMGLHLFRDLDVTTVEKGGVGWIPLFIGCWVQSVRHGGRWYLAVAAVYLVTALYNLYFAVVCAAFAALSMLVELLWKPSRARIRRIAMGVAVCSLVGVPVGMAQIWIQSGGPAIATPEQFLWERAALDGFTLFPLQWNRLEIWRACNPIVLILAAWTVWNRRRDARVWRTVAVATGLFVVSLGPTIVPGEVPAEPLLQNPVYMALHSVVPGFWRLAKPEVFFQPVWWMITVAGALGLHALYTSRPRRAQLVARAVFLSWWPLVRLHPDYPGLSAPLASELDPRWQERVFQP